jgi:hypothetical protein
MGHLVSAIAVIEGKCHHSYYLESQPWLRLEVLSLETLVLARLQRAGQGSLWIFVHAGRRSQH